MNKEKYQVMSRRYAADSQLNYCLAVFGDHLVKRAGIAQSTQVSYQVEG